MTRSEILLTAEQIINGERQSMYGTPEDSFAKIAEYWSAYLDTNMDAMDVAIMMVLFKVARLTCGAGSNDTFVDCAGYAAIAGEIYGRINKECI